MDAEILVAEDESAIREGLCALLESEGYTVRAAVDGEDALRLFRECRPDLVLLDVMMPKKKAMRFVPRFARPIRMCRFFS